MSGDRDRIEAQSLRRSLELIAEELGVAPRPLSLVFILQEIRRLKEIARYTRQSGRRQGGDGPSTGK